MLASFCFFGHRLDPAPGSYSWIRFLSNHKEFQKITITLRPEGAENIPLGSQVPDLCF